MENLTLEQAVENHRKLWNAIAFEIKTSDPFELQAYGGSVYNLKEKIFNQTFPEVNYYVHGFCWLCQYTKDNTKRFHDKCSYCPLMKPEDIINRKECLNGLYNEFLYAFKNDEFDKSRILAEQIANLPVVNAGGNK